MFQRLEIIRTVMKQYTNESQTAKLIELGFEKPKSVLLYAQSVDCDSNYGWRGEAKYNCDYTIGELIEMLGGVSELEITRCYSGWEACDELRAFTSKELIDALYDMIIMLKEEGVI